MALDLNETFAPYRDFDGKLVDQTPLLVSGRNQEGQVVDVPRVSLSVAGLMRQRLNSKKPAWKDNYFFLGDGIAYNAGGTRFKVVLDSTQLRSLNPKSPLKNGAFVLKDGVYETLQGEEFVRDEIANSLEHDLTADKAKEHPVWRALARDASLLNEHVDKMFPEMEKRFTYNTAMGVYLSSGEKVPTLRAAVVVRLGGGSRFNGGSYLDGDSGRLVGVAPEALNAQGATIVRPSKDDILRYINEQVLDKAGLEMRAK